MAIVPPIQYVTTGFTYRQKQTCVPWSTKIRLLKVVTVDRNKHVAKALRQFVLAIVNV